MGKYDEYMRKKAFLDLYSRLSEDDKRLLTQTLNPVKIDIMGKLDEIEKKVDKNKYSFTTDLGANILGNVITDSAIFILSKLFHLK